MSRFIAKGTYQIDIQEGNACDVKFVVPDEIVMTTRKAKLQIRKNEQTIAIITVDTDGGKIVKNLQQLICSFAGSDSVGYSGSWKWDLSVFTSSSDVITIGRGTVNIIPRITRVS